MTAMTVADPERQDRLEVQMVHAEGSVLWR